MWGCENMVEKRHKYIIVTGGVLSGLGKGITSSSIGLLLKELGFSVSAVKIDPYLNVDAGTMNPYQHGEVFVMDDGGEVDLDLGNYERFLDTTMTRDNNITTGKVYQAVINKERQGKYLGKTVQIIPHITNEIKSRLKKVARDADVDVLLVEVGGTVGDIESMPFLEAVRQLKREVGEDLIFVHVTLVPVVGAVGEMKTKPTQHSVKELKAMGIQPNIIVCRSSDPITTEVRDKIALFCDVPRESVMSTHDVNNIYEVPLMLHEQKLTSYLLKTLRLVEDENKKANLAKWKHWVEKANSRKESIRIGLVGKYTCLKDSYISHSKALEHAGIEEDVNVNIDWIEADDLLEMNEKQVYKRLAGLDGILIPGGFGYRGSRGKMVAIKYARENKIPFLGICFGFQLAVVEYAQNVLGLKGANSAEFEDEGEIKVEDPVIDLLPDQREVIDKGASMRLGAQKVLVKKGTMAYSLYKSEQISERHRHRYEVNLKYKNALESAGLIFSGESPDKKKMEILELPQDVHPFFMASQFHPEFQSRPRKPVPLFIGFIRAAKEHAKN